MNTTDHVKTPRKRPHALPKGAPGPTSEDPTADGHLCGSRRKPAQIAADIENGDPDPWPWCQARSGWKTDHVGAGACHLHGGNTPNAVKSARLKLAELVAPAIATQKRLLEDANTPDSVKARVAADVLDRTGYPRKLEVDPDSSRQMLYERLEAMLQTDQDDQDDEDDDEGDDL